MNPRAAINDLHPFQGCPFNHLGTSPIKLILKRFIHQRRRNISNGEGGIRTHAPLRTNGFQDRLVMTTSIPLRMLALVQRLDYNNKKDFQCQHFFSHFLQIFFQVIFTLFTLKKICLYDMFFSLFLLHKTFCNIHIFRCGNLDILIRSFYKFHPSLRHGFHYHGIVCNFHTLCF